MAMDNIDVFSNDDISEYREKREDCRKRRLPIDDEERDVIDLEAVGEVAHAIAGFAGMGYDYYFVAAVPELLEGDIEVRSGDGGVEGS
jgi:hypothetical protein